MGTGANRNRICSCGSGEKWKRCCGVQPTAGPVTLRYPGFEFVLPASTACPCGGGKSVGACHAGQAISETFQLPSDSRVWPLIIALSQNVLSYLALRSRVLEVTSPEPRLRHQAIAIGFFAAVAYRNLKAVTTLVASGQSTEAMSLVREISEAHIKAEYYALFQEEAHKLIASKHSAHVDFAQDWQGRTLLVKPRNIEQSRNRAEADRVTFPEIYENGRLWKEPALKHMAERIAEYAINNLPLHERAAWLERSGGGMDLKAPGAEAHLRKTAASRRWIVTRFMSQSLHSTIEMLDTAYDWTQPQPLLTFDAEDRADVHQSLIMAIKSAISIAASINVVAKNGDEYVSLLNDAYEFQKQALRRATGAAGSQVPSPSRD